MPLSGLKRPDFYNRVVDKGERPHLNPEWPEQVRHLLESCWRTNLDERLSFREVGGILKVRSGFSNLKEKSSTNFESKFFYSLQKTHFRVMFEGAIYEPSISLT